MKRSLPYRSIAFVVVIFITTGSMNVFAEQPGKGSTELRHEAFLRGGTAISQALQETAKPEVLVAANLLPPAPRASMPAPPQAQEGKHNRLMLWIGIAVTGTIAIYVVQRAVKNHGKVFGETK